MSHQTVDLDGGIVEVFNTDVAARIWIRKNARACRVLVRGKSYFQQIETADGLCHMRVMLNATECDANRAVLKAANDVARGVEEILEKMASDELSKVDLDVTKAKAFVDSLSAAPQTGCADGR